MLACPNLCVFICRVIESVSTSLEGQKLASFTRVSTAVQQVGVGGLLQLAPLSFLRLSVWLPTHMSDSCGSGVWL